MIIYDYISKTKYVPYINIDNNNSILNSGLNSSATTHRITKDNKKFLLSLGFILKQ